MVKFAEAVITVLTYYLLSSIAQDPSVLKNGDNVNGTRIYRIRRMKTKIISRDRNHG